MQFLVSVINDSDEPASADERAAISEFNLRLQAGGHRVFAGGLASPQSATVIDNRGGQPVLTGGPLVDSPEYVVGFWIMAADDRDQVLALATEASRVCNRKIEVREVV